MNNIPEKVMVYPGKIMAHGELEVVQEVDNIPHVHEINLWHIYKCMKCMAKKSLVGKIFLFMFFL